MCASRYLNRGAGTLLGAATLVVAWVGGVSSAEAADLTITSNTTYNSNQTVSGTLTVGNNVTLTLESGADLTATNIALGSGARIYVDDSGTTITASSSATLGSSARIEAAGNVSVAYRGGDWSLDGSSSNMLGNADMDVNSLTLCNNCYIDASARNASSPSAGRSNSGNAGGAGGSHGGVGGPGSRSSVTAAYYDSPLEPTMPGSNGGTGNGSSAGRGGGVIRIQADSLTLNGTISSNGSNGGTNVRYAGGGGGAGGSIWVTVNTLEGAGRFLANGGHGGNYSYDGGGGGGGRIAVHYNTSTLVSPHTSSVLGGSGQHDGGAGSVGSLVFVDRANTTSRADDILYAYHGWRWENIDAPHSYKSFVAHNSTSISGPDASGMPLNFSESYEMKGSAAWRAQTHAVDLRVQDLELGASAYIRTHASSNGVQDVLLTLDGDLLMENGSYINAKVLTVAGSSDAVLSGTASLHGDKIDWTGDSFSMASGGSINVSGRGDRTTGHGLNFSGNAGGGGGSHGGVGGPGGGSVGVAYYDSPLEPELSGSNGGTGNGSAGGLGGGIVRMQVDSLTLDGNFHANGTNGNTNVRYAGGGGGAGGAIWVTVDTLAGAGSFHANGGHGGNYSYDGGGGGGGRIAVHYNTSTFDTPQNSTVNGGSGQHNGGNGAVGSLVFVDRVNTPSRTDDILYAYHGWRWEDIDAPHTYGSFVAYNSTYISGPDADGMPLTFSGAYEMKASAFWKPETHNVDLRSRDLSMGSSAYIRTHASANGVRDFRALLSGDVTMGTGSYINAKVLTVEGTSTAALSGSASLFGDKIDWSGDNFSLASSGSVNVSGRGNLEVGRGRSNSGNSGGAGGSYGGRGGAGSAAAVRTDFHGSARQPILAGSAGGNGNGSAGGLGGGIVRFQIADTMTNNGRFYSNGTNGNTNVRYAGGGGGSGGSIWVTTGLLTGSGAFHANGGHGGNYTYDGGGGSGGRIMVEYDEASGFVNRAISSVNGGSGQHNGGLGDTGTMAFYDKDDNSLHIVEGWRWEEVDEPFAFSAVSVEGSVTDASAWVRDDGSAPEIAVSGVFSMSSSDLWTLSSDTSLDAAQLAMTNAYIDGTDHAFSADVSISTEMTAGSRINTGACSFEGNGTLTLRDSAYLRSPDIELDEIGSINLHNSASFRGNVRGSASALALNDNGTYFSADGYGYAAQEGPGKGGNFSGNAGGGGGSHMGLGGVGGGSSSPVYYDSPLEPSMAGSGGGTGNGSAAGAGGGTIRLVLSGSFLNNGIIRANGTNGNTNVRYAGGGGGAGGAIWMDCNTLDGSGAFHANGGHGGNYTYDGGGGGGGGIAVYYNTSTLDSPQNSTVNGGSGQHNGGNGEVGTLAFIGRGANRGSRVDDSIFVFHGWRWQSNDATHNYANFDAYNASLIRGPDTDNQPLSFSGTYRLRTGAIWRPSTHNTALSTTNLQLGASAGIRSHAGSSNGTRTLDIDFSGTGTMETGAYINVSTLTVTGSSAMSLNGSAGVYADKIDWSGRNMNLQSSARFDVSLRGNDPDGRGQNNSGNSGGGGGSHGGVGGNGSSSTARSAYYGSATQPVRAGSAGGSGNGSAGGNGGGIIRVQLSGAFQQDGRFYANGGNGNTNVRYAGGGGGAGGSIWVTTGSLSGSGAFHSNGGHGGNYTYDGGGGGGGRIMIEFDSSSFTNPMLSSVNGGSGQHNGVAGHTGTMAFYEKDIRDLWIIEGWRWEQGDAPFSYRNLKVTGSSSDASAWVRDDENSVQVTVGLLFSMSSGDVWSLTAPLTDIRTNNADLVSARIAGSEALSFSVSGRADLRGSHTIDSSNLRLAGGGNWFMENSSLLVSPDLLFVSVGDMELDNSAGVRGNMQGALENLYLRTTSNRFDATGYGYAAQSGPGAGGNYSGNAGGGGGSHGGYGGAGGGVSTAFYGNLLDPTEKGSGGGTGNGSAAGAGGGVIQVSVSGELVNNGYFVSNGTHGNTNVRYAGGGGGAGGSVNLDVGRLSGNGYFHATGGNGGNYTYDGGGGGGGRIMVKYNVWDRTNPERISVAGGSGQHNGGTGGLGTAAYYGKVDRHLRAYQGWRWEQATAPYEFNMLSIANSTNVTTEGPSMDIYVTDACSFGNSMNWDSRSSDMRLDCDSMTFGSSARLNADGKTFVNTVLNEFVMETGSWLRAQNYSLVGNAAVSLEGSASIYGNALLTGLSLDMDSSARIDASSFGAAASQGTSPGANRSGNAGGGGGGHAGFGGPGSNGSNVAGTYGDPQKPQTVGSGGGSGNGSAGGVGGGAIHMNFLGAATINGSVYANGGHGNTNVRYAGGGGGAGGSIWLEAAALQGSPKLYANGGHGGNYTYDGGGGGGGYIAVCVGTSLTASFTAQANGGSGQHNGGAGNAGSYFNACDPILPAGAIVASRGFNTPRSVAIGPGTQDVEVFQLNLREVTTRNNITLEDLRLNAIGSGNDATVITSVKLYRDSNDNGLVDQGESLVGSGTFSADNGSIDFPGVNVTIPAGGNVNFVVTYDVSESIVNNATFRVGLSDHTAASLVVEGTSAPVFMYGAPVYSFTHTTYQTPPPYVSYLNPRTVWRGAATYMTVYGGYFNEASSVVLSNPERTPLEILEIYRNGTRAGVRIPADVPLGDWHILVTTPYGSNTTSRYLLSVKESCSTGLLGICATGVDDGDGCEPNYQPNTVSEVCGNGVDEDCDGLDLDCQFVDRDGDGFSPAEGDCDDNNSGIFPREGLGCSAGRDDLDTGGIPRAVVTWSPLDDGDDVAWASNASSSWYQAAEDTIVDSSAIFTEEGDYAEITDSIFVRPFGDTVTVGGWVQMETVPETGQYTIVARGPFGGESYALWYDATHKCWVAVVTTSTGTYKVQVPGHALQPYAWTHVALSYDGAFLSIILDGAVVGQVACTGDIVYGNASNVRVGGGHGSFSTWVGRIDEVIVFGRAVAASEFQSMIVSNRRHVRYNWGTRGPVVRFSYDNGPHEHNRLLAGTFYGSCRITGRSSTRNFPQFVSIVGTSTGFEIWDEPTGKLWSRFWLNSEVSGSGITLDSVDYVAAAYGRIYLGSNSNGITVFDFYNDKIEHWSTDGIAVFNGGIGAANFSRGYGPVDGNGLRLPNNQIRRLRGWSRTVGGVTRPYVGVACPEGVWVIRNENGAAPYVSGGYLARYDTYTPSAQSVYSLLDGCGLYPVGDDLYYGINHADDGRLDILTGGSFDFTDTGVSVNTPIADVSRTMAPSQNHTCYGSTGAPGQIWGNEITVNVNWGGVRDIVVFPGRSRHPDSGGLAHLIALATDEGVTLIDQASPTSDSGSLVTYLRSGDGEDTPTVKHVLHGDTNDCTALGLRGNELFVGTNGGGVTRLNFTDEGDFEMVEFYDVASGVLPSDNITAVSCGKNALIATDDGVASIRFPEPGACDTGLEGICGSGREYIVGGQLSCVQTVFPTGETCDGLDNDCDGVADEHPIEGSGSICDNQNPVFETLEDLTVNSQDCRGALVAIPEPVVHDNNDDNPTLENNAPDLFPFGNTTVVWEATDKDGNSSTETQVVAVSFDGQPDITVPDDVTAEAVSPGGTAVNIGQATGDICVDGGVTVNSDAPATFPLGVTTVTWTVQGQQGRAITGAQQVTVVDTQPPSISVGSDMVVGLLNDLVLPTPIVSDNGSRASDIVVTHNAPAIAQWPIGDEVTVTFTATDEAGNSATDSLDITVTGVDYPAPTISITAPVQGSWLSPPALLTVRIEDSICADEPTISANTEELDFTFVRNENGWDAYTSRVSDGVHSLELTATSGCSGKTARATRLFGVDSGGIQYTLNSLSNEDVDPSNVFSWPPVSSTAELPLVGLLRDNLSGLASARATLLDLDSGAETVLNDITFDTRLGTVPDRGVAVSPFFGCTNDSICSGNALQLVLVSGKSFRYQVVVVDVAGNEETFDYYFRSLTLREAIVSWLGELSETTSENVQANAKLRQAENKLSRALTSFDEGYYGNVWLALEDSENLISRARDEDSSIGFEDIALLTADLAVDFQRVRYENESSELGGDPSYVEAGNNYEIARREVDEGESAGGAFLGISNGFFWHNEARDPMFVTEYDDSPPQGYEDSLAVIRLILSQMTAYLEASEDLPGRPQVQNALDLLTNLESYFEAVVEEGDLSRSDLQHVEALLLLTDTAISLKEAEETTLWVRNWQWGLARITALFSNRAMVNAATWIGTENPVWTIANERFEDGEEMRENYQADQYMQTFVNSRCLVVGVYNGVYDPDITVPSACCEDIRNFSNLDPRFPVPEYCIGTIEVEIFDDRIEPENITLRPGQMVRWLNRSSQPRAVSGGTESAPRLDLLDVDPIAAGGVFEMSFDAASEVPYFVRDLAAGRITIVEDPEE